MDYTLVPGVLLSNRKIDGGSPALTDIAPTILAEFGIAEAQRYDGTVGISVCRKPRTIGDPGRTVMFGSHKVKSKANCWRKRKNAPMLRDTNRSMNS